jgi:hypothetical protein
MGNEDLFFLKTVGELMCGLQTRDEYGRQWVTGNTLKYVREH